MKKNSFIEGTIIATIFIILVKILGMVYVIPFYSIVGSQGAALYGYAYSIYSIFLSISSAGIPTAISKITSEYNTLGYMEAKTRAYKLAKRIVSLLSIVCFIVLFIFAKPIAHLIIGDMTGGNTIDDIAFVIRAISVSILVVPFLSVTKGYLQGHKYLTPSSVSQLIEQLIRIIIILLGSYLMYRVFNQSLTLSVGISLLGAFFGALIAYLYLLKKIKSSKKELNLEKKYERDNISSKTIVKKIIMYSIPLIIINLVTDIYSSTDMILISRTIQNFSYNASTVEFITSSISTWCPKISMIVNAIVLGLTMSLIPNIVASFTEKNYKKVNNDINKSLEIVLFTSIPLTLGIAVLSTPIWTIFYNTNELGGAILRFNIFTALLVNLNNTTSTILQSMNKFKAVYIACCTGFILNGILDVPLMNLCNGIGIDGFYGAIIATIIGYSVSIGISIYYLKKECKELNFSPTLKTLSKTLLCSILMIIPLFIINKFLPFDLYTKSGALFTSIINACVGGTIYIFMAYKLKLIENIFGNTILNKIKRKLGFNKKVA